MNVKTDLSPKERRMADLIAMYDALGERNFTVVAAAAKMSADENVHRIDYAYHCAVLAAVATLASTDHVNGMPVPTDIRYKSVLAQLQVVDTLH